MATKQMNTFVPLSILALACLHSDAGLGVSKSKSSCNRKVLFTKIKFTCPEQGQPADYIFCCGDDNDLGSQRCCPGVDIGIENIGSIVGTIACVIGFIILLLVICCCICPCCLLYKRRNSGNTFISVPNTDGAPNVNVTAVPATGPANGPSPVGLIAAGYPTQYPLAQGQPGPAPYPMQPMLQQVPRQ